MLIFLVQQTIKWGTTVPVAAGKAVRVQAFTVEGKVDVTWKGKVIRNDDAIDKTTN